MCIHVARRVRSLLLAVAVAGCVNEFTSDPLVTAEIQPSASWPSSLSAGDTTTLQIRFVSTAFGSLQAPRAVWQSGNEEILRIEPIAANTGDPSRDSLAARKTMVRAIALAPGTVTITVSIGGAPGIAASERSFDVVVRRWKQVVGFTNVTCGLTGKGLAYCWGATVGTATQTHNPAPRNVSLPFAEVRFRSLTAGQSEVCGESAIGTSIWYCWGLNFFGQLGDGTETPSFFPVAMNLQGMTFSALSISDFGTCGVAPAFLTQNFQLTDIFCWGFDYGDLDALSNIVASSQSVPWGCELGVRCPGYYAVSFGLHHGCALFQGVSGARRTDFAACWGRNESSQLGRPNTLTSRSTADTVYQASVAANASHALTAVVATRTASCVLNAGDLICWGGRYGRTPTRALPTVALSSITGSREGDQVCGIALTGGRAYCVDTSTGSPIATPSIGADGRPLEYLTMMTAGRVIGSSDFRHYCGITIAEGAMYCWGDNTFGQLGRDTQGKAVTVPLRVQEPAP